ncbi:MAG: transporter [Massilia sp.]
MRTVKLFAVLLLAALAPAAGAADFADVTPYRPSVSNPAQLPAPGQLELEAGGLAAGNERSLPYLLKLAFSDTWGVLLGGDAYVRTHASGASNEGIGDTSLVLKRAFIVDDATAFGLELGVKLPTASTAIGSGKSDWTLNTIYSKDFGTLHVDANLNATRLGAPDPGASRTQAGASTSFSVALDQHWTATWEVSGTRNPGAPSTAQALAALSFAPDKRLVIDVGFAKGLNPASPGWSVFSGVVLPLASLWPRKR